MKPAWALAVFPLSIVASAADPPYGTAWYEMDHAKCEVRITANGLAADPLLNVSGTKVEFGVHAASVVREQPYTLEHPSNPWMAAKVESWSLTIGPPASPLGVTLPQPATLVEEIAKTVRFASTKFLDGQPFGDPQASNPIEIKLIAVFRLERPAPGGGTERSDPIPVTANVQVMPYNKVLSFAIDTVHNEADEVISQRFAIAPEHSIVPDDFEDPIRRSKNELSALLRHPTVFFVCTHGDEFVYGDSFWDNVNLDPSKLISRSENMGFCYANRSAATPPMNFAILYSCATLYGSGDPGWPFSFGLWDPYGVLQNKAYAGFPQIIPDSWDGERGSSHRLRDHAQQLIVYLRLGWNIRDAVQKANALTRAIVPMRVVGDDYARMFFVYLTPEEIATVPKEVVNSWYYIF